MASETKVGLLAGLAFIICFAVILANRGRPLPATTFPSHQNRLQNQVTRGTGAQPDAGHRASPAAAPTQRTTLAYDAAHKPAAASRQPIAAGPSLTQPMTARPMTGSIQSYTEPAAPVRSLPVQRDRGPTSGAEVTTAIPLEGAAMDLFEVRRPNDARGTAGLSSLEEAVARRRELEAALEAAQARIDAIHEAKRGADRAPAAPRPEPARTPSPAGSSRTATEGTPVAPEVLRRYSVEAGDSLTRIAQAHYGTRSRNVINAIFDVNRAVLSSPDELKVGMELLLPVLDKQAKTATLMATERTEAERRVPSRTDGRPAATAAALRRYQVRKGDRYVSIAREQLGDERRWREIFELNKDRFPDPDQIREGVTIRLPKGGSARSASAAGTTGTGR